MDPGEARAVPSAPLVDTESALADLVAQCPRGVLCTIDTEADSLFSYREKLCLIQFAVGERMALIDPLALGDLSVLLVYLDEAEAVWIHGADYDLSILNRTYEWVPRVVYDTQIAARLLGWRTFGLAHLIEKLFGVTLSKQSQKKNWGERPLPARMLEYAANDVRYILPMAKRFSQELKALDRWDWFEESCRASRELVLARPEKDRDELWRIPGWGRLDVRALGYLRELWKWRDEIARHRDKPAFKILSNDQLLSYSSHLSRNEPANFPSRFRPSQRRKFEQAVSTAASLPDDQLPLKRRGRKVPRAEDWESVYNELRARRDAAARTLDLEPSVIASKAGLERYAYAAPEERTDELRESLFLRWQRGILFA